MANVKQGDFIRIEYTGRKASDGKVFDTTDEALARKEGIYSENTRYGPSLVIVGKTPILKGIDEAIEEMGVGDKRELELGPEKAFGKRNPKLIHVLSMAEFKRHKIQPYPGLVLDLDGRQALVKSVTSGRVMIDMNHPLAGEKVNYELRVVDSIDSTENKVRALLDANGMSEADVSVKAGKVELSFPEKVEKSAKLFIEGTGFTKALKELIPEVKDVKVKESGPEGKNEEKPKEKKKPGSKK